MMRLRLGTLSNAGRLVPLLGICLCFYFMWPLLQGERSYHRLVALERETALAEAELHALRAQKQEIEKKVIGLRPGSIDRDLLDERARALLGYRRAEERVVLGGGAEKPVEAGGRGGAF